MNIWREIFSYVWMEGIGLVSRLYGVWKGGIRLVGYEKMVLVAGSLHQV